MVNSIIYPKEIILEVTNLCNLKCRFCHFHGENAKVKRNLGFMSPDIWKKILNEIQEWDRPCTLLTHGAGEPLLYPHLQALLTKAKENPKLFTGFMTNGMLLSQEVSNMLIDLKIDCIALSVDGVLPKTHDHFRKNADLKLIEKNLEYLINEKQKRESILPALTFNMVGYPDILEQENDYVKKWLPFAQTVTVSKFRPIGSRKLWDEEDDASSSFSPIFTPCPLLYSQTVISIDGVVGLCCEDINLDVPIGNVMNNDLLFLYNRSKTLEYYRGFHQKQEIRELKLCSDCHIWASHINIETYQSDIGDMRVICQVSPSGKVFHKLQNGLNNK